MPEEMKKKQKREPLPKGGLKALYRFMKLGSQWKFWSSLMIYALSFVTNIIMPILAGLLTQTLIDNPKADISGYLLLGILALTLGPILNFISRYLGTTYTTRMNRDIRDIMATKMLHMKVSEIEGRHSGDFISRLESDMGDARFYLRAGLPGFVGRILSVLAVFIYMILSNPLLALAAFVPTILTIYLNSFITKPIQRYSKKSGELGSQCTAIIQDIIGGIEAVKTLGVEKPLQRKINKSIYELAGCEVKMNTFGNFLDEVSWTFGVLPGFCVAIVGALLLVNGQINIAVLTTSVFMSFNQLTGTVAGLGGEVAKMRKSFATALRFFEVYDLPLERTDGLELADGMEQSPVAFEMKDVCFTYANRQPVLQNFCLEARRGEKIALVGSSGCGKSTVLKLLQGFTEADSGCIRILGREISEWKLDELRKAMAPMPQEAYLFPISLRENLTDAKPEADEEEIMAAVEKGGLTPALEAIGGLDAVMAERGNNLSGGQRQRASLARALLKNAPILLLDEPTSALDAATERDVQQAIDNLSEYQTLLVIAHRLRTVRTCDRILVMENGQIVQEGKHDDLIQHEGVYRRLFLSQAEQGWERCEA